MRTNGYDKALWIEAKEQARTILAGIAAQRTAEPISYSKLAAKITAIKFEPNAYAFHALLGEISEEENAAKRGMLSALVVNQDTLAPGQGFFNLAKSLGRNVDDNLAFWTREFDAVRAAHKRK